LDAIDAALGGKSAVALFGLGRAIVEATFKLDQVLAAWLVEQEIELMNLQLFVAAK